MALENTTLKNLFHRKGYKMTPQREAIYLLVKSRRGSHLSSEEIFDLLRDEHPGIGLATVYRALRVLEDMGLLHSLYLNDGKIRYEANDDTEDHRHHHLVCLDCGRVEEFALDLLGPLEKMVQEKSGFTVQDHSVKFYGICTTCRKVQKTGS